MTTAENPRAVAGANNPPSPLFAEATERTAAANRWLAERSDWEKWDGALADKANFFIGQVSTTWKALDDQRKEEGRAFKKKQDETYGDPLMLLNLAKDKLTPLRRKWLQREEDRVAEQRRKAAAEAEAVRLAAEKAAAAAAKPKASLEAELAAAKAQDVAEKARRRFEALPEKAVIKGTYTTTAKGLNDYWSAEIKDLNLALKNYGGKKNPNRLLIEAAIRECIQGIANKEAKLLKTEDPANFPPGITFKRERR